MIRIDIRRHQQTRNAYGILAEVMKLEREQQVNFIMPCYFAERDDDWECNRKSV